MSVWSTNLVIFDKSDNLKVWIQNDNNSNSTPILSGEIQEVLNGDMNLEFSIPLDSREVAIIEESDQVAVEVASNEWQLFEIKEITKIKGQMECHYSCRHAMLELADETINFKSFNNALASSVAPNIMGGSRFTVGVVEDNKKHSITFVNSNLLDALSHFINVFNVEISFSFAITGSKITSRTINFYNKRGTNTGLRFEWSRNLIEVERTVNTDNLKTALVGIGKDISPDSSDYSDTATYTKVAPNFLKFNNIEWKEFAYSNLLLPQQATLDKDMSKIGQTTGSGSGKIAIDKSDVIGTGSVKMTKTSKTSETMTVHTKPFPTPVEASTQYIFSAYVKGTSGKSGSLGVWFYADDGSFISSTTTTFTFSTTFTRRSLSFTTPSNCAQIAVGVNMSGAINTSTMNVDGFMVDEGSTLNAWVKGGVYGKRDYIKPLGVDYVEDISALNKWGRLGNRTRNYSNLLSSTYAQVESTTGISTSTASGTQTGALVTGDSAIGSNSFKVTKTSTTSETMIAYITGSNKPRVRENTDYTFSFYTKSGLANKQGNVAVIFYDKNQVAITTNYYPNFNFGTTWGRITQTFTTVPGTVFVALYMRMLNAINTDTLYIDGLQLEQGDVAHTWIQGGTTSTFTSPLRHRIGYYINNEQDNPDLLLDETLTALVQQSKPIVSYQAKVLDLYKIMNNPNWRAQVGDTVTVIDDDLGLTLTPRVLEKKTNLLIPEDVDITLETLQGVLASSKLSKSANMDPTSSSVAISNLNINDMNLDLSNKLAPGDPIQTSDLQGTIDTLLTQIKGGGGTVTITDGNGILIEQDPSGKTGGAMRLLGGIFAIASSYNTGSGDYNWRTFGTGTGFVADEIKTGTLNADLITIANSKVTIDINGVTVKDANFLVKDTNSLDVFTVLGKQNMIFDHSFEKILVDSADSTNLNGLYYGTQNLKDVTYYNTNFFPITNQWATVGVPRLKTWDKVYINISSSEIMFGIQTALVNNSNYFVQDVKVQPNRQYTVSFHCAQPFNLTTGAPQILVEFVGINSATPVVISSVTKDFVAPIGATPTVSRYSFTFTTPNGLGTYTDRLARIRIRTTNANYVELDGVQCVRGNIASTYVDSQEIYDILYGQPWTNFAGITVDYLQVNTNLSSYADVKISKSAPSLQFIDSGSTPTNFYMTDYLSRLYIRQGANSTANEIISFGQVTAETQFDMSHNINSGGKTRIVSRAPSADVTQTEFLIYDKIRALTWLRYRGDLQEISIENGTLQAKSTGTHFFGGSIEIGFQILSTGRTRLQFGASQLACRNNADTAYVPILASAFTVNSKEESKKNIKEYETDALTEIAKTPIKKYQMKEDKDSDPLKVGVIVEESPLDILDPSGEGVDLYPMVTMSWKAIQQLLKRIEVLENGKSTKSI